MMSSKLKDLLFLYLRIFSVLLLFVIGGGLLVAPILLGLLVSPYYFYLFIISMILLPLVYIGIAELLIPSHY